jgi:copper resistance protein C
MTMPRSSPPARRRRGLAALGTGLLLSLVVGTTAPAYAHDELVSSNPADGATLAAPPAQVVLTFEEAPVDLGLQVVVTSPEGSASSGSPRIEGTTVVQDVQPSAPAGRWTVQWRVTSDDGHPVSGRFAFTAQTGGASASSSPAGPATTRAASAPAGEATAAATPAPAEAPRQQPLIPSWAWIIGGVLVIALAIRINRRASAENKQRED